MSEIKSIEYEPSRNSLIKNFKKTLERSREPEVKILEQLSWIKYKLESK
jgi:hypothetical protein